MARVPFPGTPLDPVGLHQPDHPHLAVNLIGLLQRERDLRAAQLVKGFPKTLEEYKWHVGIIEGLDLAIATALEAKLKAEA